MASYRLSENSDRENVAKLARRPRGGHLSGKRVYSGAFLQIFAQGAEPAPRFTVAAPRDVDEAGIDASERWRR
eukprot:3882004-Pyramimonas_sp.AAC.1